jgi:uncharacterized protein
VKLRSSLFLGFAAFALLRCTIYDSDALGGADATTSSKSSTSGGQGGDQGASTSESASSTGSPDASSASTTDATASTTTADTSATTDTSASSSALASSSTGVVVVDLWINELHYDNDGADVNEGVEIAGTAGADLTGWSIVAYNGSNGAIAGGASTVALSGTVPDQMNGKGTRWFPIVLENGIPDGVALVDAGGAVVQFLSWNGTFTGSSGPATGVTSIALPVTETPAPLAGSSLQLTGTGDAYVDFTWVGDVAASRDAINASQTLQ